MEVFAIIFKPDFLIVKKFVEREDLFYYVRLTDLELSSWTSGADVDAIAAIGAALRFKTRQQSIV